MTEFVGPDSAFGFGWGAFTTHFKLLDFLDNVIQRSRPSRVTLVITPWNVSVGHVVGEGPLRSFQGRRPTVDGSVAGSDIIIRITMRHKTHETLNVIGPNIKKFLPSEGSSPTSTVKFNGEAILKFHEPTNVGVILLLVRHDPSDGIVIVELMLGRLFRKRIVKKEFDVRKRREKETNESTEHGDKHRTTQ